MRKHMWKKDAGTIFNPVMFLVILLVTAQLLVLFVEYKRLSWVSDAVTDTMTDALLGACVLNEEELYRYGSTDALEILYPKEKYDIFKEILTDELGLTESLQVKDGSLTLLKEQVNIRDFKVYSVSGNDITVFDFDETGGYTTTRVQEGVGNFDPGNGEVIQSTTLVAEIGFTVDFLGLPLQVSKYHMVDVTK